MVGRHVKAADHEKCQQKEHGGHAGQRDQADVDAAMQALARAAILATREVLLVVAAHLGGDTGNIVAPACQDAANDRIAASSLHFSRYPNRFTSGRVALLYL